MSGNSRRNEVISMNTRAIATEYRLAHWAGIMREREESGLSIKAFSEKAGFHENRYYYWQKKLRETACEELMKPQVKTTRLAPVFAEVKLASQHAPPLATGISHDHICIEAAGVRITAGCEYPVGSLTELLRAVSQTCY